jgi:hypothetical protein
MAEKIPKFFQKSEKPKTLQILPSQDIRFEREECIQGIGLPQLPEVIFRSGKNGQSIVAFNDSVAEKQVVFPKKARK